MSLWTSGCVNNSGLQNRYISKKIPIILTQDIPKVGQKGEEMEVSKGYARNFFFMRGFAVRATHETRKQYEEFAKNINYAARKEEKENLKAARNLQKEGEILIMRTSKPGTRDPSVTINADNISYSLKRRKNIIVDPSNILIDSPLSTFGNHTVRVAFGNTQVPLIVRYEPIKKPEPALKK
eukprot:gene6069-7559_t